MFLFYPFYLIAAALVFLSYKSLRGGINYLSFFKQELSKPVSNYTPLCSIIAPCRGLDEDLEKNLIALYEQEYPEYEIIFVVDSESDAAVPVIQKLISAYQNPSTKIVVAGKAENEGQKVHNLRQAVTQVSDDSKVFVFVDSDARPKKDWLKNLIAPLADKNIGCATGYRWFIQKNGGFATHLRSVWNASIASALGANTKSNFCWGGSTAIRRETFEKVNLREQWRGTLSDDFMVTRTLKEAELPVYFVPQCLTASVEDCSLSELFEFTTRQMKITRVYAPHLWKASLIGSLIFNLVWVSGLLIIIFNPLSSFAFWYAAVSLFLIFAFSTGKAWFRLEAVKLILRDYEKELNNQFLSQNILWIITPALFLYNCICGLFSRKIFWRGISYYMKAHNRIEIIENDRK